MAMSGARRIVLWRVDAAAGVVRADGVAGGAAPSPHVMHGSAITWIAREGVSARLDPPPVWATTQRVIGVPVVEDPSQHALTFELADEVDVNPTQFEVLGIHVGALLNVLKDHDILTEYQVRTEHLLNALRALPTALTQEALAQQLVDVACNLTAGVGACLSLWDGNSIVVLLSQGGGVSASRVVEETDSITVLAARNATTMVRDSTAKRSLKIIGAGERFTHTAEMAVAVPLVTHGSVVGVLTTWSVERIAEAAINGLETIAPYAAAQLISAQQLGEMRQLAERDGLTGLLNRRAFDQQLSAEAARFERYRRPFAVILMDIDHFKKVNDQYGHDAGDIVIRKFAEIIASSLRDVDVAARYGGEEFALLLPETDKSHAVEIAERIRRKVEASHIDIKVSAIGVTSSAGVASVPDRGVDPTNVVKTADQLLYEAKRAGRNRVAYR